MKRQRPRQQDAAKDLRPRRPHRARHLDELAVGVQHAGIGVDDDRHHGAEEMIATLASQPSPSSTMMSGMKATRGVAVNALT